MFGDLHDFLIYLRYLWWIRNDKGLSCFRKALQISNPSETIQRITESSLSVSRFGDGEFAVMSGRGNGFQKVNSELAARLNEVISNPLPNLLVCIPSTLKDWSHCTFNSRLSAAGYLLCYGKNTVMPNVTMKYKYGDSLFTRFYMMQKDKSKCSEYAELLKKIWNDKDLLIVEGKYSRLGVGNDLFDNAKSIKRILCPNNNAFDKYDDILESAKTNAVGRLVILALGMTATLLAYDLCKEGIRALDLGHIDIEYEWMLMGAKEKCPIPHKQMSEVVGGRCTEKSEDKVYLGQIIDEIE